MFHPYMEWPQFSVAVRLMADKLETEEKCLILPRVFGQFFDV